MNIEGTYTFTAPRDVVWPMMLDSDVLAKTIPGCEKLEQTGENSYSGILNIRVGPAQGRFNGTIDLSEINAPEGYQLTFNGNGASGSVSGASMIELVDEGDSCTVQYRSEAQVGGQLADIGQRLLETSARAIVRQSLEALERQINIKMHPEMDWDEDEVVETAVYPPTQPAFAAGVAKNMLTEIIPPEQQERVKVAGAVTVVLFLLAMILFVVRLSSKARRQRHANEIADILEARARRYNN